MDKIPKNRNNNSKIEIRLTKNIEDKLKSLYDFLKEEEIPDKFMVLLSELERTEKSK